MIVFTLEWNAPRGPLLTLDENIIFGQFYAVSFNLITEFCVERVGPGVIIYNNDQTEGFLRKY